jgi:peptidoglycan/xylan/chitin deacetylase (PgdA/CDA1 family)
MRASRIIITISLLLALLYTYEETAKKVFPKHTIHNAAKELITYLQYTYSVILNRYVVKERPNNNKKNNNSEIHKDGFLPGTHKSTKQTSMGSAQKEDINTKFKKTLPKYDNESSYTFHNKLFSLWSPLELEGKSGDEIISKINPPDLKPPQKREPDIIIPPISENRSHSIRSVKISSNDKPVALTFDLCEQADDITGYDRAIVNTLRHHSVRASFFVGGKWMRNHVVKTQQLMADPNFELGNHGWTHGNLRVLKGEPMIEQIKWTQSEYERIYSELYKKAESRGLGDSMNQVSPYMKSLRFPFGTCSRESLSTVNKLGLTAIQWDVVSADAVKSQKPEALYKNVLSKVQPGSIVVFHANGRGHGTAKALPMIISDLRDKGYRFVTISELLELGEPVTSKECYELIPGDNMKYDELFGDGTGANKNK